MPRKTISSWHATWSTSRLWWGHGPWGSGRRIVKSRVFTIPLQLLFVVQINSFKYWTLHDACFGQCLLLWKVHIVTDHVGYQLTHVPLLPDRRQLWLHSRRWPANGAIIGCPHHVGRQRWKTFGNSPNGGRCRSSLSWIFFSFLKHDLMGPIKKRHPSHQTAFLIRIPWKVCHLEILRKWCNNFKTVPVLKVEIMISFHQGLATEEIHFVDTWPPQICSLLWGPRRFATNFLAFPHWLSIQKLDLVINANETMHLVNGIRLEILALQNYTVVATNFILGGRCSVKQSGPHISKRWICHCEWDGSRYQENDEMIICTCKFMNAHVCHEGTCKHDNLLGASQMLPSK